MHRRTQGWEEHPRSQCWQRSRQDATPASRGKNRFRLGENSLCCEEYLHDASCMNNRGRGLCRLGVGQEQRKRLAVEWFSVRRGEHVLRSRARICSSLLVKPFIHRVERRGKQTGQIRISSRASICSSFLVRAMKQEHQDSDQELCRNDSI